LSSLHHRSHFSIQKMIRLLFANYSSEEPGTTFGRDQRRQIEEFIIKGIWQPWEGLVRQETGHQYQKGAESYGTGLNNYYVYV